jgi:hypothetical protein
MLGTTEYPDALLKGFAQMSHSANRYLQKTGRGSWNVRDFFRVKETLGPSQQQEKLITCSLFYAPTNSACMNAYKDFDYTEELTLELARSRPCSAVRAGRKRHMTFFEAFLEPFLLKPPVDWDVRAYVAPNMSQIAEFLADRGVQVHVMSTASVAHNPGACWRYLAFDDSAYSLIYSQDADNGQMKGWINQLEALKQYPDVALARNLPGTSRGGHYHPLPGSNFTVRPSKQTPLFPQGWASAMLGFTSLNILSEQSFCNFANEYEPTQSVSVSSLDRRLARGVTWPNEQERQHAMWFPYYFFDEQFLKQCVYPRVTRKGRLATVIHRILENDQWQPRDLKLQRKFGNRVCLK